MFKFVVGAAAGYVLGTRAGRKRYHQIKEGAQAIANSPVTKQVITQTRKTIANRLDPNPRMREVKDVSEDKRVQGQQILEQDED